MQGREAAGGQWCICQAESVDFGFGVCGDGLFWCSAQNKGPGQEGAPPILTSLTKGFWAKMSTPYLVQLWNVYPLGWSLGTV